MFQMLGIFAEFEIDHSRAKPGGSTPSRGSSSSPSAFSRDAGLCERAREMEANPSLAACRTASVRPSVLPEPVESVGTQLGISHRVHDVAVTQEVLQRAGIHAIIG
jgi:hypothetical protein